MVAGRERKPIPDVTAIKWASRLFDPAIAISTGISNRSNYDFFPTQDQNPFLKFVGRSLLALFLSVRTGFLTLKQLIKGGSDTNEERAAGVIKKLITMKSIALRLDRPSETARTCLD